MSIHESFEIHLIRLRRNVTSEGRQGGMAGSAARVWGGECMHAGKSSIV